MFQTQEVKKKMLSVISNGPSNIISGLWLYSCHSLHLYHCSLPISVKLTKNCPKPRANLVRDVRQMTQFFMFLGSFPLSKTGMQGKTCQRGTEREKQAAMSLPGIVFWHKQAGHCLTMSPKKYQRKEACFGFYEAPEWLFQLWFFWIWVIFTHLFSLLELGGTKYKPTRLWFPARQ